MGSMQSSVPFVKTQPAILVAQHLLQELLEDAENPALGTDLGFNFASEVSVSSDLGSDSAHPFLFLPKKMWPRVLVTEGGKRCNGSGSPARSRKHHIEEAERYDSTALGDAVKCCRFTCQAWSTELLGHVPTNPSPQ